MAKTARKTPTQAGRRRAKASPRVSTRRLPAARDKSLRRGTPAKVDRAIARAAPETLQVTLDLRDVSGRLIRDPETFFTFRRVTDIDENGDLLGHFADLFKHKITGGTHPHDIHELLVLQDGNEPGFDLGYRLA